jgi:hypothetical protein
MRLSGSSKESRVDNSPGYEGGDPDTGLAPQAPHGLQHVLNEETATIWRALREDDLLVMYQHQTNRSGRPWIEGKRQQFEDALGVPRGSSKVASASEIARDVVFYYCRKNGAINT